MNKKEWLDKLYYDIGKQQYNFWLCGLKKDKGGIISTKWKKYSEVCFSLDPWEDNKIKWVNQRQILPIEIVLDIENKDNLSEIIEKLNSMVKNYLIYDTGSKGYHIHLFSKTEVTTERKEYFIKKFGADIVKAGKKTLIALENTPHWKTGKVKTLITKHGRFE